MEPELRNYGDGDGGLSEADVDRTVAIIRRFQLAARIVAMLIIVGLGATAGAVIAYRTGADIGGVPRA